MSCGYAGKILKIDLSNQSVSGLETANYARLFLGGRGIGDKLYWDFTAAGTKAFDPDNSLIFVTGPVTGFMRFAAGRVQICGKSPEMEPVWLNSVASPAPEIPWGGFKESGIGKEYSQIGFEDVTQLKVVGINVA